MLRRTAAHRWLDIGLRTAHLAAMAFFLGGAALGDAPAWSLAATVATGLALCASDVARHGDDWFRYAQAWAVIGKVAVFTALAAAGEPSWAAAAALVVGSVISHAPGAIRHAAVVGEAGPCASNCTVQPSREAAPGRRAADSS